MANFARHPKIIPMLLLIAALSAASASAFDRQDNDADEPVRVNQLAQPDGQSAATEQVSEASVSLEQITVIGQRTFFSLRNQIEDAKEALYSSYNDLNIDDELDVNCRPSDWTGTHIKEQVCWPVFFESAVAQNSQDFMRGNAVLEPVAQLQAQHQDRFDELRTNIMKVARENPEVEEALMELGVLEAAYERKRKECMEQTPFLLLFRICQ